METLVRLSAVMLICILLVVGIVRGKRQRAIRDKLYRELVATDGGKIVTTMRDVSSLPLAWVGSSQPKSAFILYSGKTVVARGSGDDFGGFGAEAAGGEWGSHRNSAFAYEVLRNGRVIATYHLDRLWGKSKLLLKFPDGQQFYWRKPTQLSFWPALWTFTNTADEVLVRIRSFGEVGEVEIEPSAAELPELVVLVLMGWCLILPDRMAFDPG